MKNTLSFSIEKSRRFGNTLFEIFFVFSSLFTLKRIMPPKFRTTKRPKRKFLGNQFTKPSKDSQSDEPKEEAHGSNTLGEHTKKSVSSKKLLPNPEFPESKLFKDEEPSQEEATITGFRFVDMKLLSTAFSSMSCA